MLRASEVLFMRIGRTDDCANFAKVSYWFYSLYGLDIFYALVAKSDGPLAGFLWRPIHDINSSDPRAPRPGGHPRPRGRIAGPNSDSPAHVRWSGNRCPGDAVRTAAARPGEVEYRPRDHPHSTAESSFRSSVQGTPSRDPVAIGGSGSRRVSNVARSADREVARTPHQISGACFDDAIDRCSIFEAESSYII